MFEMHTYYAFLFSYRYSNLKTFFCVFLATKTLDLLENTLSILEVKLIFEMKSFLSE